jgi:hypothetical protein
MTERLQQPNGSGRRTGRRRTPRSRARGVPVRPTIPVPAPRTAAPESEPTILGFPAEVAEPDDAPERPVDEPTPDVLPADLGLVVLRRADRFGGGALILAGVAANASLTLAWSPGGPTGLSLVRRSVEALGSGVGSWLDSGLWQPLVVVLSGGLLVLLGVLMLVPARAHRLVGVLSLAVSLAAAGAVAVLVSDGWAVDRFGPGMWCAVAVPVLGLAGSLKAMLTAPLVALGAP